MNRNFWERFAGWYDFAMKKGDAADRKAAEYIAEFVTSEDCLLEAACGTGRFSCALAPFVSRIESCDYSENMVFQATKKAQKLGLKNITFSVQDIFSLSFQKESFDAAMAANVLHLLPQPEQAVTELMRTVKPGGLLIFPNFVNAEGTRKNRTFLRLLSFLGFRPTSEWSREQFLQFLTHQGLAVKEYRMFSSKQPMCVAIAVCAPD